MTHISEPLGFACILRRGAPQELNTVIMFQAHVRQLQVQGSFTIAFRPAYSKSAASFLRWPRKPGSCLLHACILPQIAAAYTLTSRSEELWQCEAAFALKCKLAMLYNNCEGSLLYVPQKFLSYVRLETAAQHQLGIAIQAGLGRIDKPPACSCATVTGQLLSATEPADVQLCQPTTRPKSVEVVPGHKERGLSVSHSWVHPCCNCLA